MNTFAVSLRKELVEQWRSARLLIAGVVLLLFGLTSPLLAKLTPELLALMPEASAIADLIPEPTTADAVAQYLNNISQFGIILALLLTMGSVANEKERGTAAMVLSKPLPRWQFLMAKFAALGLTFGLTLALAGAACYYYTWLLFEPLPLGAWVALNGLMWLVVMVYVALTMLCSVLARSVVAAGGLAFGALIAVGLLGAIPQLGRFLPGQLLNWGTGLVIAGLNPAVAAPEANALWPALIVCMALIAGALALAAIIFERQEL